MKIMKTFDYGKLELRTYIVLVTLKHNVLEPIYYDHDDLSHQAFKIIMLQYSQESTVLLGCFSVVSYIAIVNKHLNIIGKHLNIIGKHLDISYREKVAN